MQMSSKKQLYKVRNSAITRLSSKASTNQKEVSVSRPEKNSINIATPSVETDSKWYAIYTRSRFEKKLYGALCRSPFEAFLPLIKQHRVWSDRIKLVQVPLLPSYVFVRISKNQFHHLYGFPGLVRIISFGGQASEIKEQEIALMRSIVNHGFSVQSTASYETGDKVRIVRGPLRGWEGCVQSIKGKSRVIFHITSIQQSLSVEIEMGDLEKV